MKATIEIKITKNEIIGSIDGKEIMGLTEMEEGWNKNQEGVVHFAAMAVALLKIAGGEVPLTECESGCSCGADHD